MFKNKKVFLTILILILSVCVFVPIVFAQNYVDPDNPPPGGNVGLNFLENPLNEDLDLDSHQILNASEVHTDRLFISGSLDIAGQPANANEAKWAFGATAGKVNSASNAFTYGFYGKTISNSGSNPSFAVYGESNNLGGRAIYGKANNGFAVYGEATNNPGVYGLGTTGVFGLGDYGIFGQSNQAGGAGIYGHAGSGDYAGYFDGLVLLANGGQLYVETSGNLSPIVGVANYDNNNAGVQGYGNIGVYGGGDVIGVYGYGEQGVIAKGARTISIVPPPGGEWEMEEPVENNTIISWLGLNKTQASVGNYTAYTVGLIAAGGSNGGATLTHAGLGLCAVSGAKDKALGVAAMFYNQAGGTALAIEGNIDFAGVRFLRTTGEGSFSPYNGANGVRVESSNLTVDGILSARSLQAIGDSEFSGNLTVVGQGYFDYLVHMDGGAEVEGYLRTDPIIADVRARDDDNYPFGVSAIVGMATSTNAYEENAGVTGVGTVGVFGHGRLIGVYGSSGAYAGLFKGYTDEAVRIDDPEPDRFGSSGNELPDNDPFSSLLGINKTMADVSIPAAIGIVATGGWDVTGANFNSAGLGICALSGEKAYAAEQADGDFYEYCQDTNGTGSNNYAGFFGGDVYVKEGSMQLRDTLVAAGENLIYGNIGSASAAGSHLIKLQTNGSDKFKVDRAGNAFLDGDLNMDDLIAGNITADDFVGDIATFDQVLLGEDGIIAFDTKGKNKATCVAETEGYTYYFQSTKALCICTGSAWKSLINSQVDSACR